MLNEQTGNSDVHYKKNVKKGTVHPKIKKNPVKSSMWLLAKSVSPFELDSGFKKGVNNVFANEFGISKTAIFSLSSFFFTF